MPEKKLQVILDDIEDRLRKALDTRITPTVAYNPISAPDLTAGGQDTNWEQPCSLLGSALRTLTKSFSDSSFRSSFSKLSFTIEEFRRACEPFEDQFLESPTRERTRKQLSLITGILDGDKPAKDKCKQLWKIAEAPSGPKE